MPTYLPSEKLLFGAILVFALVINILMSNYGDQRLYLYDDMIEVVVSTDGNFYVDNRPMNLRTLQAHKGLTNEIFFVIRDRDRKLQNVFSDTLRAYLVDPHTKRRIVTKLLHHTSDVGKLKLVLTAGDITDVPAGLYHIYVTRTTVEDADLPVYNDQNNNIRFSIDITDQASVEPVATQENISFMQSGNTLIGDSSNSFVSSALTGNLDRNFSNAQHTLAVYTETYTGNVKIQASCLVGTPNSDDASKDWFDVTTLALSNITGITHETFQVNCNWVRVVHYPDNPESVLNKILLRN